MSRCSVGCLGSDVLLHSAFTPLGPGWLQFLPEFRRAHVQQLHFEQEQLWGPALMSGYYHRFGHFGYLGKICLLFYSLEKRPLCKARCTAQPEIWCFLQIQSLFCLIHRKGFGVYKMKHQQNLSHVKILLPVTPRLSPNILRTTVLTAADLTSLALQGFFHRVVFSVQEPLLKLCTQQSAPEKVPSVL